MFSISATNTSPVAPPATPAANLLKPARLFKSLTFFTAFCKLGFLKLSELPALLVFKALSANFCPNLKPTPPGIPICVNASVSLPTALLWAYSSKGLSLSKNCSTSAAVSVSAPKSINSAASENTPSGTLMIPDAIPATPARKKLAELLFSAP